jgi:hypothetical protein
VKGGKTDLGKIDPGPEVDLYMSTDLRTMTAIWMGLTRVDNEVTAGRLQITGDNRIRSAMQRWLGPSPFATERKRPTASVFVHS